MEIKTLSIIIATYNRLDALRDCLAAMPWETMAREQVELIVVSDGAEDGTVEWLREQHPELRLLAFPENHGLSYARNTGARAAHGELLWFLDDDVAPQPGWLEAVLAHRGKADLFCGKILDWDGAREQGGPARSTFIGKRVPCAPEQANAGTGCNLGVNRHRFEALNGFDEAIRSYGFEDSDFCIRAKHAGFSFLYLPEAVIRHKGHEIKTGDHIRSQERNSTCAMLKIYRNSFWRRIVFSLLNGAWMSYRYVRWSLCGRNKDAQRLLTGWREGYRASHRKT